MLKSFRALWPLLLAAGHHTHVYVSAEPEIHDDDSGLFTFKSRADIRAPKWNVTVYDRSALASGYWFFGPYETLDMDEEFGNGWIGPHIYTDDGTLIWSGAPMFDNGNTEDFRLSNVNGEDVMTVMDQRHARGVFINNHYEEIKREKTNGKGMFNSHEFHIVDNGTKALVVWTDREEIEEEESAKVGFQGRCEVDCNGINEFDVETWERTFTWSSCRDGEGNIGLDESTLNGGSIENKCRRNWDYVHANSIDKTVEGDYIYSCRHADAIYKISAKDGSIIWRLGGVKSDFEHIDGFKFSRQHNIRYRGGNSTHTLLSMLDNAKGRDNQEPTYKYSRGLLIALDESNSPMTARIAAEYMHPDGEDNWAFRRGNYQVLSNGNVFMCWSERALQSEHTPDGKMIMQARLEPKWLGTYRAYKFDFVGLPLEPPDVNAEAIENRPKGGTTTMVHVSWNGATEVSSWKLYHTTKSGEPRELVDSADKTGFETKLTYAGYAKYVLIEALAHNGSVIGNSGIISVDLPSVTTSPAVKAEDEWQKQDSSTWSSIAHNPIFIGIVSVVLGCLALVLVYLAVRRSKQRFSDLWKQGRYASLKSRGQEMDEREGKGAAREPLMERSRRDTWDGEADVEDAFMVGDEDEDEDEDEGRRRSGEESNEEDGREGERGGMRER